MEEKEEVINEIKEEVKNKEHKVETTASHNHEKVENIEKQEEIKKEIKSEEKITRPDRKKFPQINRLGVFYNTKSRVCYTLTN